MGRWGNRWGDRTYTPRPKLQALAPAQREAVLEAFRAAIQESPVLSALGWEIVPRRGRFTAQERPAADGGEPEEQGRITPLAAGVLLLEVRHRTTWSEVARDRDPAALIAHIASDDEGTFHGLGPLDAALRSHGLGRREMCATDGSVGEWWYLDRPPGLGPATVVETLYHAFGVPIPVIAEPRGWWECHRTPSIAEHRPDAVLVDFEQESWSGQRFGGRCLYARRDGAWGAYTIKPNQSESIDTSLAWLGKRGWSAW